MKKSYSKFIALGSLVILTFTYSCKKLLNREPVGSLSGTLLANKAGLDGLLIGAYSMLDGYTNTSGTSWESGIDNWTYGGIASDDAYKGSNTTDQGTAAPIENHTVDENTEYLNEKWVANYTAVQRCNDVIREVPLITDGSVTPAYGAEVIAEAKFLRGIYNMELAKVFRNVPYVDETVTYLAGNYNIPNSGPIWDKIEADFKLAMAGLPKTPSQTGRAYYYAAEALLGEAYMFDHQYSLALPLFTDIMNNGTNSQGKKFALGPYEDNFNAVTRNSPESVFQVQMTANDGSNGSNDNPGEGLNFPAGTYTGCCGFYQPSYSLANAFKTQNGLPMLGTTQVSVADYNSDNKTTSTVSAVLANYNLVNLGNDNGYAIVTTKGAANLGQYTLNGGSGPAFVPPSDALDPRIDWTMGRYGIPYLDWGLCGGEQWSRGDVVPYNPIKNVFFHSQQTATSDNFAGWAANQGTADNYNLVRLSDVILWAAECEVDGGSLANAEADVNMVRNRMAQHPEYWVHTFIDNTNPSAGFTNTPAANYVISPYNGQFTAQGKTYARGAVYMEEQLEFGMEGKRFFNLQRADGLYGGPAGSGYMAGVLNGHIAADTRISNPVLNASKFTAGKNEIFPIPLKQITLEQGKLKQNPLY